MPNLISDNSHILRFPDILKDLAVKNGVPFFKFLTFSCLYDIFGKKFIKKNTIFNVTFLNFVQNHNFVKFYVLQVSISVATFQCNTHFGKKVIFINVFSKLLLKTLSSKKLAFFLWSWKFHVRYVVVKTFMTFKFLLLTWRLFWYNVIFEIVLYYWFNKAYIKTVMKKLDFQNKLSKFILRSSNLSRFIISNFVWCKMWEHTLFLFFFIGFWYKTRK